MRVDLNCPAEIAAVEIRREEDCVRLILMDLADRPIDSCESGTGRARRSPGRCTGPGRCAGGRTSPSR